MLDPAVDHAQPFADVSLAGPAQAESAQARRIWLLQARGDGLIHDHVDGAVVNCAERVVKAIPFVDQAPHFLLGDAATGGDHLERVDEYPVQVTQVGGHVLAVVNQGELARQDVLPALADTTRGSQVQAAALPVVLADGLAQWRDLGIELGNRRRQLMSAERASAPVDLVARCAQLAHARGLKGVALQLQLFQAQYRFALVDRIQLAYAAEKSRVVQILRRGADQVGRLLHVADE